MTNEERKNHYMNRNVKLSPLYIALTWDVIFVWAISTMFLSTQKGLTASQIISLDSILMLAGCIMCIPVTKLFEKVDSIKASQIGVLGYAVFLVLYIFGNNFIVFACAQIFLAFGYVVNGIKVNLILTESLYEIKRDKDYQRVFGQGFSMYYIIEALGAIITSYLYTWQPYAAFVVSLGIVVFVELYSLLFKSPTKFQKNNINIISQIENQTSIIKKPDSYLKILKSGFFVCLLIFMFFIRGILSITNSGFKVYLQQMINLNVFPMWLFGYVYAGTKIVAALSSKYQFKFNLKFGVRTLVVFTFLCLLSFFAIGFANIINPTGIVSLIVVILFIYVQNFILAPSRIFVNNYMQVCMPKRNIEKAHSLRIMVEYLGYAAISAVYAVLLEVTNNNFGMTNLVYISIFGVPLLLSMVLFVNALIKKHAQKYTVIKDEYTKD